MKIAHTLISAGFCWVGLTMSCASIAQDNVQGNAQDNELTESTQNIQDTNKPRLKLGINAVYSDKEFNKYASELQILPSAFYEGKKFYARGDHIGYHFSKNATDEYSLYAQYAGETFNPEKALDNYTKLDEKQATVMVGVSYLKITKYGGFQAKMAKDFVGDSKGKLATLAYLAKFGGNELKELRLYPSVGLQWQDKKYNNHYYGVTDKETNRSGVKSYNTHNSLHPYTSVMGMYDVTENFGLFLNQSAHFYQDTHMNSPKVDGGITFSSAVGLTYSF